MKTSTANSSRDLQKLIANMDRASKQKTLEILREQDRRKKQRETAERLRGNFRAFIRESWHVVEPAMSLIDNWHIDAIGEHLQAVADGQIKRLMINIGPGYAKSLTASVQFSAWLWTKRPAERILAATYAAKLTVRDSVRTRDLVMSDWYRDTFSPEWEMVKANEDYISNSLSGFRLALSVGSVATGFRGNGQIFDDLLNASDKHSEAARDTARDWAMSTMSTRFNDMRSGWRVVIGQRLHELDPYGAMLKTGEYEHLCLPSEFEPERRSKTSIGWTDPRQEAGELLFPELFTPAVIEQAKRDLGPYDYAGQHQQRPAPAEGGIVKRDWWQPYTVGQQPTFDMVAISVDAAFKETKDSDFVAIHVYGCIGPRTYLIDRVHEKLAYNATKQAISSRVHKWKPRAILIEDKANGTAIISELKKSIRGIIAITPKDSKESRAWACSPDIEAGNVYLPADEHSMMTAAADEVIEEWAVFPNGANDDDVDAMTQMLNWLRMRAIADTVYGSCFTPELYYSEEWLQENRPGLRNSGGHTEVFIASRYGAGGQVAFLIVFDDGETLWFDEEIIHDPLTDFRQKADVELVVEIQGILSRYRNAQVIVNADAVTFTTILGQSGIWYSECDDSDVSVVVSGIRKFSSLMTKRKARFHERCQQLIGQMSSYAWDEKAARRGEDKPSAANEQAVHAARMIAGNLQDWRLM
jgi:predicted phage terminase large subunit-like protein